jgi:KaiC/GvpD/RAD55 family RecA-like ATPase
MKAPKKKSRNKDFTEKLTTAVQKLINEKLGGLENAVLLGNRPLGKSTFTTSESYLYDKVLSSVQVRVMPERKDFELGEDIRIRIELRNLGKAPVQLLRIENLVPATFDIVGYPNTYHFYGSHLDLHGIKLEPYIYETIEVIMRSNNKGTFPIVPRIIYTEEIGQQMSLSPEPISIIVTERILPNRVPTGFKDLDNLMFGGIPQNCSVLLTAESCDERDLIVKRYIEAGALENDVVCCVTVDPNNMLNLARDFPMNLGVLVCNSRTDKPFENLPNLVKTAGIENLTEMSIGLESLLRKLGEPESGKKRFSLEILSDVLLHHHADQTRRWLSGLIPELRSRGFTTLAVINPQMHSPEELHAVLDLFECEIVIYRKTKEDLTKYLRIKKMYNHRYVESELVLKKTRLMTMPLRLSCCTRNFSV